MLFLPALIVVCIGLVVTLIGIPFVAVVVPVSVFTLFVALMLGFTAIACRCGEWIEDRLGWRGHSALVATTLGLLLIVGPTMLSRVLGVAPFPLSTGAFALLAAGVIFEYIMWTIGLGATLMTGFGRWSTCRRRCRPRDRRPVTGGCPRKLTRVSARARRGRPWTWSALWCA